MRFLCNLQIPCYSAALQRPRTTIRTVVFRQRFESCQGNLSEVVHLVPPPRYVYIRNSRACWVAMSGSGIAVSFSGEARAKGAHGAIDHGGGVGTQRLPRLRPLGPGDGCAPPRLGKVVPSQCQVSAKMCQVFHPR